jgi:hypothetical protein
MAKRHKGTPCWLSVRIRKKRVKCMTIMITIEKECDFFDIDAKNDLSIAFAEV